MRRLIGLIFSNKNDFNRCIVRRGIDFPASRSIAVIHRHFLSKETGKESSETNAYISNSIDPSPFSSISLGCIGPWRIAVTTEKRLAGRPQTACTKDEPLNMSILPCFAISFANLADLAYLPEAIHQIAIMAKSLLQRAKIKLQSG